MIISQYWGGFISGFMEALACLCFAMPKILKWKRGYKDSLNLRDWLAKNGVR